MFCKGFLEQSKKGADPEVNFVFSVFLIVSEDFLKKSKIRGNNDGFSGGEGKLSCSTGGGQCIKIQSYRTTNMMPHTVEILGENGGFIVFLIIV